MSALSDRRSSAWRSSHADRKKTETELNRNQYDRTFGHGPTGYSASSVSVHGSRDEQQNHSRPVRTSLEPSPYS